MTNRWIWILTLPVLTGILAPPTTRAADPPSLDDLLNLTPPPPEVAPAPPEAPEVSPARPDAVPAHGEDAPDPAPIDADAREARQLEQLRQSLAREYQAATDAFESAVIEMGDAADRLAEAHDPHLQTQRLQEQVLDRLDQMIAAAKKQQGGGGSGNPSSSPRPPDAGTPGQAQPGAGPRAGSTPNTGQAAPGAVGPVSADTQQPLEELGREWGDLPPRLRDALSQGLAEQFSPLYRELTRAYYERLAREASDE